MGSSSNKDQSAEHLLLAANAPNALRDLEDLRDLLVDIRKDLRQATRPLNTSYHHLTAPHRLQYVAVAMCHECVMNVS